MKNIVFINAGAGSGKTYKLTEILTQNIQDKVCRADQVILTTFTKKAAGEFRSKAREALLSKNLTEEANLLASAAIGTVHSVAQQLINKYWYYLGVGVDLNVMEVNDIEFFMNQALADIPSAEQIEKLSNIATQLQFIIEQTVDEERWKKDLKAILDLALTNGISDFNESYSISNSILHEIYVQEEFVFKPNEIRSILQEVANHLPGVSESNTRNNAINNVKKFLQKDNYDNAILYSILSFLNALPAATKQLNYVQELISQLEQPHRYPGTKKMMEEYQQILFELAGRSLDAFRKYKDENKLIDYNDMEVKLLELLKIPEITNDIRKSYKQVYVDEFQDSSPIQVEIFTKLSEIADQSWWVGDPKQSIYGFRGSDPMLIKSIVDEFNKNDARNLKLENLPYSWRSRPEIVHLNNQIFTSALASQVTVAKMISLKPVRTGNKFLKSETEFPLKHWHHRIEGRYSIKAENECISQSVYELLHLKMRIENKSHSRYDEKDPGKNNEVLMQCNPGDIAILRLQNKHISSLASSLRKIGIEVAAFELGLKDTAEIQLLMAILYYLMDKSDIRAKALILTLGGIFLNPGELLDNRLAYLNGPGAPQKPKMNEDEEKTEEYSEYLNYSQAWYEDNFIIEKIDKFRESFVLFDIPSLMELIIHSANLPDLVNRWDNPDQRVNNLQTSIKLAKTYSQRCTTMKLGASINGFLQYINDLPDKDLTQSAATGKNSVNIVTYHKAKGLEWPVVILADLYDDKLEEKSLITREFYGVQLDIQEEFDLNNPLKNRKIVLLPSPLSNKAVPETLRQLITGSHRYSIIKRKVEDELKRLLYVGMTRARDYLITTSVHTKQLTWVKDVTGKSGFLNIIQQANLNIPTKLDSFETGDDILVIVKEANQASALEDVKNTPRYTYKKAGIIEQNDPRYKNPSSIKSPDSARVEILQDFNIRITQTLSDREDELGNCLHNIYLHFKPDADKGIFISKTKNIIDLYGLTSSIPEPDQIYNSINALFRFLVEKYGTSVKIYGELPLQHEKNGYIFRGESDLVWETKEGIVIVDYKSFPGTKLQLIDPQNKNFAGKYAGQLGTYKEMIEASHPEKKKVIEMLLYYSVIGIVLKVS